MSILSFLFYFSYVIFYKPYLCRNIEEKHDEHLIREFSYSKDDLINRCLQVNRGLIYYEDLLKNYKYDRNCLKYKYIGNYVLEKYEMNEFNCYEKIQKALCKLNYINKENIFYVKNNTEEKKEHKGYDLLENNLNSKFSKCHNIKTFFVHLINRCINYHEKDSLVHCASFDYEKHIILDGDIFCKSSFEQVQVEQNINKNSIYGDNYKKNIRKTISFQNDDFNYCINMVNIFNNCSVVQNKLFNKTVDICLLEKNTQYCNIQLEKVKDQNYIYTCSDIILPYLLSSHMDENNKKTYQFDDIDKYNNNKKKDEENQSITNKERCYNIYNYLQILKDNKKKLLQERKVLEQNLKNINIINKLYKIIYNILEILKNETHKNDIDIKEFFEIMQNIKSNKFIKNEYIILILNKINEQIFQAYQIMVHFHYPILNKNTINENISLVNHIKENVNHFIMLYKDIASNSRIINQYIKKNNQNDITYNHNININKNINHIDNINHTDNKKNLNILHNINKIKNDSYPNSANNILEDKNMNEINIDQLQKFKQIYHNINKLIQKYTKQTNHSVSHIPVLSSQDVKRDIDDHNSVIDLYTDQISLLIKNNILS
ncbi:hypothetical protein PGSY75_1136100 [Plasmodium gaboni]|uniref:Uncharacterized protein n=1 Tax=Plasmodium gaboni TaxID=647221 RepID=A0A151LJ38_9APIC|nr:hypothetical protein PGSY75_1136100 [Plasmodium gaboni]KYN98998.1 hypothetical protein PGSY75_1136100 [Plasmodium gaboni]